MFDTAAVAAIVSYITSLFRQIVSGMGYEATRAMTLLFMVIAAPIVALAAWTLDIGAIDGWRAALVLGLTSVPVAIGLYEAGKTLTEKVLPARHRNREETTFILPERHE